MAANPYQAYQQQSVLTMTQGEMLNRLYEELVKQLSRAEMQIEKQDVAQANDALQRAQKILYHLKATLNFEYEVSHNLSQLYDFFLEQTLRANVKKTATPIGEILPMIVELKDTFVQADRIARTS